MSPAVKISKINKKYGNLHALRDINFSIEKNSYFGLLGPNGAGKSTLINIMAGLVIPTSGAIEIMGYNVSTMWRKARMSVGIVPQELVYDSFFTVREMLRLQSGYFGYGSENYPWIDQLIESLRLTEKSGENLQRLSGGMKRRVLIAQALVHKPRVIVLDEPTAGVDVELRQVLWDLTRKLHGEGHTILLTTHYIEEAEALCQKIAILDKGRLVAMDTTKDLLKRYPYRFFTIKFSEDVSTRIEALPESVKKLVVSCKEKQLTLKLHREKERIGDALEALISAGTYIVDMQTDEPGLEEVFRALTGEHSDE